jgi:hypothetical protein
VTFATKARNRLDIVKRDDLSLTLTALHPDIQTFANVHQAQETLNTRYTQKNGAVSIVKTIETAPLFCVHPV